MSRARLLLALIAALALGYGLRGLSPFPWAGAAAKPELVNGSFESGLDGWKGSPDFRVVSVGTDAFHGSSVLEIDPGEDPARLSTDVLSTELELEPGQAYRIRLQVQSSFSSTFPRCGLLLNGRSVYHVVAGMPTGNSSEAETPRRESWTFGSYVFFADRRKNTLMIGPLTRYSPTVPWGKVWLDDLRIERMGWTRSFALDKDLKATLPSEAVVGEDVELHLVNLGHRRKDAPISVANDRCFEVPLPFTGTLELSSEGGRARIPSTLSLKDESTRIVPVRFETPGIHRVVVRYRGYVARSNPVRVLEKPAERQSYWGDIHIHTQFGHADWYGGDGEQNYRFAREVADLDFACLSEHYTTEIRTTWVERLAPIALRNNEPGRFVTFLGVETGGAYGHWNFYLRGSDPLQMFEPKQSSPPTSASALLKSMQVPFLVIPHHLMLLDPVDWRFTDHDALRVAEIYSNHGLSEEAGKWWRHPLQSGMSYQDTMGARGHDYRTALARGHRLGVIACSDDHTARPGLCGLTCVQATSLDREPLFDALHERRCYATSGARILLDFEIEGAPQGSELFLEPGRPLRARFEAHGTSTIDQVQILRNGELLKSSEPRALDFEHVFDLGTYGGRPTYFQARLSQSDQHRAWSSPIWIDPAGVPDLVLEKKDLVFDRTAHALVATPNNYGSTTAKARVNVHSSARDRRLGEVNLANVKGTAFLVRLEPIDDEHVRIKALLDAPLGMNKTFTFSGRIDVHEAGGLEVVTDPRGMLRVQGESVFWEDPFGVNYTRRESKNGQISDFELVVGVRPGTWVEIAPRIEGEPPALFLGDQPETGPTLRLDELDGLASRTLVAQQEIELAPGIATELTFPKLREGATFVVVLDADGAVQETNENNNASTLFVPLKYDSPQPQWPEYRPNR